MSPMFASECEMRMQLLSKQLKTMNEWIPFAAFLWKKKIIQNTTNNQHSTNNTPRTAAIIKLKSMLQKSCCPQRETEMENIKPKPQRNTQQTMLLTLNYQFGFLQMNDANAMRPLMSFAYGVRLAAFASFVNCFRFRPQKEVWHTIEFENLLQSSLKHVLIQTLFSFWS